MAPKFELYKTYAATSGWFQIFEAGPNAECAWCTWKPGRNSLVACSQELVLCLGCLSYDFDND